MKTVNCISVSLLAILFITNSYAAKLASETDPKQPNIHAIKCNLRDDQQKLAKVKQVVNSEFAAGHFTFMVVDIINGNIRQFSVYVPERTAKDVAEQLLPATVTLEHLDNQAQLDAQIVELQDVAYETNQLSAKALGSQVLTKTESFHVLTINTQIEKEKNRDSHEIQTLYKMPISSGYKNVHIAVSEIDAFDGYLNGRFRKTYDAEIIVQQGKPILKLKARQPSAEIQDIIVNPAAVHQMMFADGSTLEIKLELVHQLGVGIIPWVSPIKSAKDKMGKPIPLEAFKDVL